MPYFILLHIAPRTYRKDIRYEKVDISAEGTEAGLGWEVCEIKCIERARQNSSPTCAGTGGRERNQGEYRGRGFGRASVREGRERRQKRHKSDGAPEGTAEYKTEEGSAPALLASRRWKEDLREARPTIFQ